MSMLYNVELKAEALKAQQTKPASQDLASAFFKAQQKTSQTKMAEVTKASQQRATIYEAQLKTVYKPPAMSVSTEEVKRLIEKAQTQQKQLTVAKASVSHKPSPQKERLARTELQPEEVTLPTLGAPKIPESITVAGYQIKTAYLLAGLALVIIVAVAFAMK